MMKEKKRIKEEFAKLKEKSVMKVSSDNHPTLTEKRTLGQKASDGITKWMGSWTFISLFTLVLLIWIVMNSWWLIQYQKGNPFDPFPFILLNLVLSCIAAIQAPIIMMSQNRQSQKDRIRAEYDYQVNRKAMREIETISDDLKELRRILKK